MRIENIHNLDYDKYTIKGNITLEKIKKYLEMFQRYFEEFKTAVNLNEGLNSSHADELSSFCDISLDAKDKIIGIEHILIYFDYK